METALTQKLHDTTVRDRPEDPENLAFVIALTQIRHGTHAQDRVFLLEPLGRHPGVPESLGSDFVYN